MSLLPTGTELGKQSCHSVEAHGAISSVERSSSRALHDITGHINESLRRNSRHCDDLTRVPVEEYKSLQHELHKGPSSLLQPSAAASSLSKLQIHDIALEQGLLSRISIAHPPSGGAYFTLALLHRLLACALTHTCTPCDVCSVCRERSSRLSFNTDPAHMSI